MSNTDPIPKFWSNSFDFGSDPIPSHREEDPLIPDYADLWTVSVTSGKWVPVACDIPNAALAKVIAAAAARRQEATKNIYGYTDSVVITNPDNIFVVTHRGESPSSQDYDFD